MKVGRKGAPFETDQLRGVLLLILLHFTKQVLWLLCFTKFDYHLDILIKVRPRFVKSLWRFWGPLFRKEVLTVSALSPG